MRSLAVLAVSCAACGVEAGLTFDDAYQESLDLAVYLRTSLAERHDGTVDGFGFLLGGRHR